ncbi:hypothetical protein [Sphingobium sp. AS12]|uniref:hypothetical protein n=1 Tax=Sphingobium sp. AS12 TaxID=2849495 RepID=UPI0020C8C021|nr:hypothetical protein [Sphingobium sp. AS12]
MRRARHATYRLLAEIDHADGYDVQLQPEPYKGRERLFFVDLGGYDPADFAEQHRNMFVVTENLTQAKARAMATLPAWKEGHRDDLYEAEKAIALHEVIGEKLHIHFGSHRNGATTEICLPLHSAEVRENENAAL